MRVNWRFWVFALLAISLVIAIERVTTYPVDEHHQNQSGQQTEQSAQPAPKKSADPTSNTAQIVPLYAEGDLLPKVPTDAKPLANRKEPEQRSRTHTEPKPSSAPRKPTSSALKALSGDRPVLEVAYKGIGFSRYLDVIERVGRLFILVDTEAGARLGPEISLKRRLLYQGTTDFSILALKRPHLVSDERIRNRLSTIEIPATAYDDSVVLVLTRPFDSLLWDTIEQALRKRHLQLNQVSQIVGDYVDGGSGVFLQLGSAVVKGSGKLVELNKKLRVSL